MVWAKTRIAVIDPPSRHSGQNVGSHSYVSLILRREIYTDVIVSVLRLSIPWTHDDLNLRYVDSGCTVDAAEYAVVCWNG